MHILIKSHLRLFGLASEIEAAEYDLIARKTQAAAAYRLCKQTLRERSTKPSTLGSGFLSGFGIGLIIPKYRSGSGKPGRALAYWVRLIMPLAINTFLTSANASTPARSEQSDLNSDV